jgi:hypothetical protein
VRDPARNAPAPVTGSFSLGGSGSTPPILQLPPTVTPGETAGTIEWTTDEPATSEIDYGASDGYGKVVRTGAFATRYSVVLTGLAPATTYHYRVGGTDPTGNTAAKSGDLTFATASLSVPLAALPLAAAVLGIALVVLALLSRRRGPASVSRCCGSRLAVPGVARRTSGARKSKTLALAWPDESAAGSVRIRRSRQCLSVPSRRGWQRSDAATTSGSPELAPAGERPRCRRRRERRQRRRRRRAGRPEHRRDTREESGGHNRWPHGAGRNFDGDRWRARHSKDGRRIAAGAGRPWRRPR